MSAAASRVDVFPVDVAPGIRPTLERDVARMLGDVPGYNPNNGLVVVGGLPGYAAAVEPVRLPPLGTPMPVKGEKLQFMICFPPNYAGVFARSVNPGLIFGTENIVTQGGKLPGMSSRVVEGTILSAFSVIWPHLFVTPPPALNQILIRNWEVTLGGKGSIGRVNVGLQIVGV